MPRSRSFSTLQPPPNEEHGRPAPISPRNVTSPPAPQAPLALRYLAFEPSRGLHVGWLASPAHSVCFGGITPSPSERLPYAALRVALLAPPNDCAAGGAGVSAPIELPPAQPANGRRLRMLVLPGRLLGTWCQRSLLESQIPRDRIH
eukprot:scaffold5297_cov374-Prasinococcus_capsulatus_cf.AAC.19